MRRQWILGTTMLVLLTAICWSLIPGNLRAQQSAPHRLVTRSEYDQWQTEYSNWGRWGKEDEMGTLNLITPTKRKQAAALVKEGVSISLSADVNTVKGVDNPCPAEWAMLTLNEAAAL